MQHPYEKLPATELSDEDIEELQEYKYFTEKRQRNSVVLAKIVFVILLSCFVTGAAYIASYDYLESLSEAIEQESQEQDQMSQNITAAVAASSLSLVKSTWWISKCD